jgi:hypothetical protein
MVAKLDRETEAVNGKKTLIRKVLHRGSIYRLASEVVFMQSHSRLTKTTGEFAPSGLQISNFKFHPLAAPTCSASGESGSQTKAAASSFEIPGRSTTFRHPKNLQKTSILPAFSLRSKVQGLWSIL